MVTVTFEALQVYFPEWLYYFACPPVVYDGSSSSVCSLALIFICLFDYNHPTVCEVVSHCGLHFPNDQ